MRRFLWKNPPSDLLWVPSPHLIQIIHRTIPADIDQRTHRFDHRTLALRVVVAAPILLAVSSPDFLSWAVASPKQRFTLLLCTQGVR